MAAPDQAAQLGVGGGSVDMVPPPEHNAMMSHDTPGRRHKHKKHKNKKGSHRKARR